MSVFLIGALAACNLVLNKKEKIFNTLYKALNSANSEIQETAHDSMKMVNLLRLIPADIVILTCPFNAFSPCEIRIFVFSFS